MSEQAITAPPSGIHRSALDARPRVSAGPAVAFAVLLHVGAVVAALVLPQFFDRPRPLQKPIIAHLVALGRPRDPHLLPRKESPPPAAAPSPPAPGKVAPLAPPAAPAAPGRTVPTAAPKPHAPTRQQLMERALARAAGRAEPSSEPPDPERAGSETGSASGTAATAEEGDAYFTAVHDAILDKYVVPSVISERERMALSAQVLARIGGDGRILSHDFQKKSGNHFFDEALELAIQRAKLPPPPAELRSLLRDRGVVLNFQP